VPPSAEAATAHQTSSIDIGRSSGVTLRKAVDRAAADGSQRQVQHSDPAHGRRENHPPRADECNAVLGVAGIPDARRCGQFGPPESISYATSANETGPQRCPRLIKSARRRIGGKDRSAGGRGKARRDRCPSMTCITCPGLGRQARGPTRTASLITAARREGDPFVAHFQSSTPGTAAKLLPWGSTLRGVP
jgi:hypothetical protein